MRLHRRLEVVLLTPLGLLLISAVVIPGLILLGYSLFVWQSLNPVGGLTGQNYLDVLTAPLYRRLLDNTVAIALPTTLFSVVGGGVIAYRIVFSSGRGRGLMFALVVTALMASYLVRIYAWRTLLGDSGIINSALETVGLISKPLDFLLFTRSSAVLAETTLFMPLVALSFYAALSGVPGDLREAARDLGAGRAQTLVRITLPLVGGTLLAMTALTFFLSAGDYVTPVLVGGTDSSTFGTVIATRMGPAADYGTGAAISFLVLIGFSAVYIGLRHLLRGARLLPSRAA
jgi:ABC-type spermidine/putrescine transport system permease subunit I